MKIKITKKRVIITASIIIPLFLIIGLFFLTGNKDKQASDAFTKMSSSEKKSSKKK